MDNGKGGKAPAAERAAKQNDFLAELRQIVKSAKATTPETAMLSMAAISW